MFWMGLCDNVLVRQFHPLRAHIKELVLQCSSEERRMRKDILVGSEETLITAYDQGDNRTRKSASTSSALLSLIP